MLRILNWYTDKLGIDQTDQAPIPPIEMLQRISNFPSLQSDDEPLDNQDITNSAMEDAVISSSTQLRNEDMSKNKRQKRLQFP